MSLRERLAAAAPGQPCFCRGPWRHDPEAEPDTTLGREHPTGSAGCSYTPPRQEWRRRLPARVEEVR